MKSIWKFQLETIDKQELLMPIEAEVLTIQVQNEILCLWALVNTDANKEVRVFEIFGTGNPVNNENKKYIGSYQLMKGAFVGHVFESI